MMRTTATKFSRLVFAALLLTLVQGTSLYAQEKGERGYIEIGVRVSAGDDQASKYLEYRDIPNGLYVRRFELRLPDLRKNKYFFSLQMREAFERDQAHLLEVGRYGKFRLQLRWDQTPHFFANTTSSLFTYAGNGVFTFPAALRAQLTTSPTTLPTVLQRNAPWDNRIRRHMGGLSFTTTPTNHWTMQFNYSKESQLGFRPFGTTLYFTNTLELPEPIDYRTERVNIGAEYASKNWIVQFGYSHSLFKNNNSTLFWENPFRTTNVALQPAEVGQLDLYPDNRAYSLSFAAAVKLPKSSRFTTSIVRTWMRQDDQFLPFTTNTELTVPALPATSLHGEKQTLAMNYTFTSRVLNHFPLSVRYRSYDYDNDTPSLFFADYVATDVRLEGAARRSLPFAYHRQNLIADIGWEFGKASSLKFVYNWERMKRQHRDVEVSDEHTFSAALDLIPKQWQKWFLFRMSYRHSDRQPSHYEANEESFPFGEPGLGQLHDLRKFDQAARRRDVVHALLQVDPTDKLSFAASYGTTRDKYNESLYGLLNDRNYNYTLEGSYALHPTVVLFADFTRERYKYDQKSRQRTPATLTAPVNDSTLNDWVSNMQDMVDTGEAGIEGNLLKNKMKLQTYYSFSTAKGITRTRALGTPGVPGFIVTSARDYPNSSNRIHSLVSSFRIKVKENFYPRFEYRFEKYGREDFQTAVMAPYMGNIDAGLATSIFLGVDSRPYRVHSVTFSLGYQF